MRHELKSWPEYFNAILEDRKTFEVRNTDGSIRQVIVAKVVR